MLAEKRQHSTALVPYTYYECSIRTIFPLCPCTGTGSLN